MHDLDSVENDGPLASAPTPSPRSSRSAPAGAPSSSLGCTRNLTAGPKGSGGRARLQFPRPVRRAAGQRPLRQAASSDPRARHRAARVDQPGARALRRGLRSPSILGQGRWRLPLPLEESMSAPFMSEAAAPAHSQSDRFGAPPAGNPNPSADPGRPQRPLRHHVSQAQPQARPCAASPRCTRCHGRRSRPRSLSLLLGSRRLGAET